MEYELARQLRDVGFPQEGAGKRVADPEKIVATREDFAYVPTLEELIEACGIEFFSLVQKEVGWQAYSDVDGKNTVAHELAPTPTEAVARLWLSLNSQRES